MVRSPKHARPSRVSAPVSFRNEHESGDEDDFGFNQKSKSSKTKAADVIDMMDVDDNDSDDGDVAKFLQQYKKQQAKKLSARTAALDTQKKAIFVSARAKAVQMSTEGVAYLESLKATLFSLRDQELSHEEVARDLDAMEAACDQCSQSVLNIYPTVTDDLFVRREQSIETASSMLRSNPTQRQDALDQFLRNAHAQVERARDNERVATDATNLIKHYKNLLLA